MRTCLEVMDYHYPIYKLKMLTPPGTSVAGDFISEVVEYETIVGHWEDMTYEMINRAPEGIYNVGDRMFYSGVNLEPRDKLIIVELNGGKTKWEVQGRNQKLPYWDKIGVRRYSYHLKQIQMDVGDIEVQKVSEGATALPETPIDQLQSDPEPAPQEPLPEPEPPTTIDDPVPEPQTPGWVPSWMEDGWDE